MAAVSEETRRLQKALRARDKWQKKCEFEREVRLLPATRRPPRLLRRLHG